MVGTSVDSASSAMIALRSGNSKPIRESNSKFCVSSAVCLNTPKSSPRSPIRRSSSVVNSASRSSFPSNSFFRESFLFSSCAIFRSRSLNIRAFSCADEAKRASRRSSLCPVSTAPRSTFSYRSISGVAAWTDIGCVQSAKIANAAKSLSFITEFI